MKKVLTISLMKRKQNHRLTMKINKTKSKEVFSFITPSEIEKKNRWWE